MSQHQHAIDPPRPTYLGLKAAAHLCPTFRGDKPTHASTLTRWILKGVRLQDGQVLRLAAKRFPGGWGVTTEAIDEFVDRLTRDHCGDRCQEAVACS